MKRWGSRCKALCCWQPSWMWWMLIVPPLCRVILGKCGCFVTNVSQKESVMGCLRRAVISTPLTKAMRHYFLYYFFPIHFLKKKYKFLNFTIYLGRYFFSRTLNFTPFPSDSKSDVHLSRQIYHNIRAMIQDQTKITSSCRRVDHKYNMSSLGRN